MLPFQARVDMGAMATKGYSTFPKAPASLEPHYQIVWCHIQDTRLRGGLTLSAEVHLCILQPQPTEQPSYGLNSTTTVFLEGWIQH